MSVGNLKSVFGGAVRSKRSEMGFSQEELADRSGLHRTYISDVERGTRNPSLESIRRLAVALEVSVSALFQRADYEICRAERVEILLIEDDREDVELTQRAFQKARITNKVHVARDGAEALDFIFATGGYQNRENLPLPGLILLDLNLPKVDGLVVLRRIKSDPRTQKIPVIVLTASNRDEDVAACRRLGVESYIGKPVVISNFTAVVPAMQFEWALLNRPGREPA